MSLWWVFAFLIGERLFELVIAERNKKRLFARGGQEYHAGTYLPLVMMHLFFLLALILESAPWHVPLDRLTIIGLTGIILLQAARYWCIMSLGEYWNTRIIVLAGSTVVRTGPYRFLRHPNYLVVTLEFVLIPLLMRAPLTLLIFFPINLILLRRRIRLEEQTLQGLTNYRDIFQSRGADSRTIE